MNHVSVSISHHDWKEAHSSLFTFDGCENAGVFLCGINSTGDNDRLLVRRFVPVPPHLYVERLAYHLEIAPAFYNSVVSVCERDSLHPVIIHSHPGHQAAWYSKSDDYGESQLLAVLQDLLPEKRVASLVVTPSSITGRRLSPRGFIPLSQIRVFGPRFHDSHPSARDHEEFADSGDQYDRQIRAFGVVNQRQLASLRIGVVGLGGTGSVVAEQLVRSGIGGITLVDDDVIETSNLSRVLGATAKDVGKPKVEVAKRSLKRAGNASILVIADTSIKQAVLQQLRDCDLVFSCVDNDRSRAVLSRFSYQYLIPVIDLGVRLDARGGDVQAAAGRVSIVGTDATCLRCSHHLDSQRIRSESMSAEEREHLAKEGYAIGLAEPVPSVMSLNTTLAGLGVTACLNLFTNLTGGIQPAGQIYDATSGSVFPISPVHESGCDICDPLKGVKALGDNQIVSAY